MAVIDVFTYNGEREVLDIRLNTLGEIVDRFIVCEAKTTFTGKKKPLYFDKHEGFFRKWWKKIDYFIINENYSSSEIALAEDSPNTLGASHWKREFLQKESIQKALKYYHIRDTDQVYIGDVDEIWEPVETNSLLKLKLRVYAYYLNNRSNEEFWGTLTGPYKYIKNETLNHLRTDPFYRTASLNGWHFTSIGGYDEVKRKLESSYTEESYYRREIQDQLKGNVENGQDFLGRPFIFKVDESEWPRYLKQNKYKYARLCK